MKRKISLFSIVVIVITLLFFVLQFFTFFIDKYYWIKISFLLILAIIGGYRIYYRIKNKSIRKNIVSFILYIFYFLFFTVLFIGKLAFFTETRNTPSDDLLRTYTDVSIPHSNFEIKTNDNITIKGYQIKNGFKEVVIVCHGATRSKDVLANVILSEWLASDFDVIAFDFRGHHESGGNLCFDEGTVEDLHAIVKYAKQCGYEKIGLVGHSLGGWSSMLYAGIYHDVNSVVSAGSPLTQLDKTSLLSKSPMFLMPLYKVLGRIEAGFRFTYKDSKTYPSDVVQKISPIPLLLFYDEIDPVAGTTTAEVQSFFNKAKEPKKLVIYKGTGHVLNTRDLLPFYVETKNWFLTTLK